MPAPSQVLPRVTSGTSSQHGMEVWSEKGTIRGVLKPVLNQFANGFRAMHGFAVATTSTISPRMMTAAR